MRFRQKHFVGIAAGIVLLMFVLLACTGPTSPDGRYVASEKIGAIGDWYYEFRGGVVYFVCHADATYTSRTMQGRYLSTPDGWVWIHTRRTNDLPIKLEPGRVSLRLSTPDGSHESWRRRLLPGRRPGWMLEYLPWDLQ
jgi:hypothetical protein